MSFDYAKRFTHLLLIALLLAGASLQAFAGDRGKILLHGSFGTTTARFETPVGDAAGHTLSQQVRVDPLSSNDPNWDGLTNTIHEQLDGYPTAGTYRIYGEFADPTNPSRGKAFGFIQGKFTVTNDGSGNFVEANFEAKGHFIGGTGDFAGIRGKIVQKGSITPADGGRYTLTLTLNR